MRIERLFLITFLFDIVLYAIPKVQGYYLQFDPYFYDADLSITGESKSKNQFLVDMLINFLILVIVTVNILKQNYIFTYILSPLAIFYQITYLYFYGEYIYGIVFKKKTTSLIDEFKNRRSIRQFKASWIFFFSLFNVNVTENLISSLISHQLIEEIIILLIDFIYKSTLVIFTVDSISVIIKDCLILFNKEKFQKINSRQFFYNKMYTHETEKNKKWGHFRNSKKIICTITYFILYIFYKIISVFYFLFLFISSYLDDWINILIVFLNKFINKNLYTFPRIIFIIVIVFYYIFLIVNDIYSEQAITVFEYISTIFIIPLLIDELKKETSNS